MQECLPVVEVFINAMLNRNISQFVNASNLDLHSDLDVIWNILGEAENASIDDVVNHLLIIQISSVANHRTQETNHGIDLNMFNSTISIYLVVIQ